MARKNCIRINVGDREYKDKEGKIWYTDKEYVKGSVKGSWGCFNLPQTDILSTSHLISNTLDTQLFQTIRLGEEVVYRFDLPDGDYEVNLFFAEIYWETGSAEQQDVYIQNKKVLKNFNIYDDVGHDNVLKKTFRTKITHGCLEIKFIGRSLPMHSGARVNAIEIKEVEMDMKP